jgi:RNA polymerase sigma factor (sigma-70 family)
MLQKTLELQSENTAPAISSSAQDRVWIDQTLAGDPLAYSHLVHKYKNPLLLMTYRVLKDRCQGEDILQAAFVQAYRHLGGFRSDSKFSTWIYAIVMNGLRNQVRRNKVIRWSSLDARQRGKDGDYVPEMPHREPSIEITVERKMDIEVIRRIIASFPQPHQSIMFMYYFENLSLREIAERIKRPLGTVKVYLHRSRKRLYIDYMRHTTPIHSGIRAALQKWIPSAFDLVPAG